MSQPNHATTSVLAADMPVARRRGRSRWWLAGLLVGCLLPAGLIAGDAARHAERVVQICLLAPHVIRAESRRAAWRRRWQPRREFPLPRLRRHSRRRGVPPCRPSAAHDVLTRRGPPACPAVIAA
ncbi:hypothetical protein [Litchfieldella rifensis]|uniref:Uncharacterized protein n=1 Tax=Litchfieldella rifensis TaxID=762643 RepID=A0ABV7LMR7_9GAMM